MTKMLLQQNISTLATAPIEKVGSLTNSLITMFSVEPSEPLALRTSIKLNNLRASMPVTPPELSLISYALVRPVVAYMNTNYTSVPLNFDVFIDKVRPLTSGAPQTNKSR
jgi:hypothetical protein